MYPLNLDDVRSEALFVSALQPSEEPTAAQVRDAIARTVRTHGTRGCAARVAQEFGDTPHAAVNRMRWARQTVAEIFSVQPRTAPARLLAHAGPRAA
jgi:hypothetical protein